MRAECDISGRISIIHWNVRQQHIKVVRFFPFLRIVLFVLIQIVLQLQRKCVVVISNDFKNLIFSYRRNLITRRPRFDFRIKMIDNCFNIDKWIAELNRRISIKSSFVRSVAKSCKETMRIIIRFRDLRPCYSNTKKTVLDILLLSK